MCFIKIFRPVTAPFFHVLRPSKTTGRESEESGTSWGQLTEHVHHMGCVCEHSAQMEMSRSLLRKRAIHAGFADMGAWGWRRRP